jgi:hypothetical protein
VKRSVSNVLAEERKTTMTTSHVNGNEPTSEGAEGRNVHGASKSHTVNRRTIVQGAAWSIPVVAVAVGAPLAAASPAPTLTFTNGPYTVDACGTLDNVTLHATTDGTSPNAGDLVTISLPTGLTFADGSTTKIFTTDAGGNITLTGIRVSGTARGGAITATDSTSTATTAVTVTPTGGAFIYNNGTISQTPVPAGSTPVTYNTFVDASGNLWVNGALVASGLDPAKVIGDMTDSGTLISWTDTTGQVFIYNNGTISASPGVPAGSTPVTYNTFVDASGNLWVNGALAATNVDPAKVVGNMTDNATLLAWAGTNC